jgi:colanic acid/amylovoran biosynthesis glycosyltransferase
VNPVAVPSAPVARAGRVAYLVNQYPKPSHSFIRREIQALERLGWTVERFATRGWSDALQDPQDLAERERTAYLLRGGALVLAGALLGTLLRSPARLLSTARQAWTLGRHADRPLAIHAVYLAEACLLVAWMQRRGVQHLHAHFGTNTAAVALLARALGGPPYSFTVHGPEEFDRPAALKLREKARASRFVVAVSSFGRSQLFRWLDHADWAKVQQVHCGLDGRWLAAADAAPVAAVPRLVCVGRLCEQKGQLLLIDAVRRVVQAGVAIELVLAGDGEMRPAIEQAIAHAGLKAQVRITGWIGGDRVTKEILSARALVLPSFAEGLPVVLMEAMALQRPVISTYVAGIPELVRPGENGWLVAAGDAQALADALVECLAAPVEQLQAMGRRARERALARHNVNVEAARLALLFDGSARTA